jgi:ApaG protein
MSYSIEVEAEPAYIAAQSDPDENRYVFSYTITIRNTGDMAARLKTRHWVITNANGEVQEVRGDGVVGEQPHIKPGEGYQYTSGSIMETPVGSMRGSYQMVADDGTEFGADIPTFTLAVPGSLN